MSRLVVVLKIHKEWLHAGKALQFNNLLFQSRLLITFDHNASVRYMHPLFSLALKSDQHAKMKNCQIDLDVILTLLCQLCSRVKLCGKLCTRRHALHKAVCS